MYIDLSGNPAINEIGARSLAQAAAGRQCQIVLDFEVWKKGSGLSSVPSTAYSIISVRVRDIAGRFYLVIAAIIVILGSSRPDYEVLLWIIAFTVFCYVDVGEPLSILWKRTRKVGDS